MSSFHFAPFGIIFVIASAVIPIALLWYVIFSATRSGVRDAMKEMGTSL
jgi:hypothetical protein